MSRFDLKSCVFPGHTTAICTTRPGKPGESFGDATVSSANISTGDAFTDATKTKEGTFSQLLAGLMGKKSDTEEAA